MIRRRIVSVLGLLLLAACAAEPPAAGPATPAPAPASPPLPLTASGERPITTPPPTSGCALWLDPFTKNTDLVQLYYQMNEAARLPGASPMAVVETGRAAIARTREGIDKLIVTVPLQATYDAQKGVAHIATDPARGDSIFADLAPGGTLTRPLGDYTLAVDSLTGASADWDPIPKAVDLPPDAHLSRGARYGVALLDVPPTGGGHWASAKGGLDVPLSPERAKAAYGRLSVKIVADLSPPGLLTGKEIHPATKTSGEWEAELRVVTGRTVCAAIITANDGEMVKRLR